MVRRRFIPFVSPVAAKCGGIGGARAMEGRGQIYKARLEDSCSDLFLIHSRR